MKKISFLAALTGILFAAHGRAFAAYPVYTGYQGTNAAGQVVYLPTNAGTTAVPTTGAVVTTNVTNAASPTRITGALPRVGSNATAAGRQYYEPTSFDRLADSGLYVGFSVGYSASVSGSMVAEKRVVCSWRFPRG